MGWERTVWRTQDTEEILMLVWSGLVWYGLGGFGNAGVKRGERGLGTAKQPS
jgi:hypothetical protein